MSNGFGCLCVHCLLPHPFFFMVCLVQHSGSTESCNNWKAKAMRIVLHGVCEEAGPGGRWEDGTWRGSGGVTSPFFGTWKNGLGCVFGYFLFILFCLVYIEKHMFFCCGEKVEIITVTSFQAFLFRFWGDGCCKKIGGWWHDDRWHWIYFSQTPCDAYAVDICIIAS